jgi:hypothetical protein
MNRDYRIQTKDDFSRHTRSVAESVFYVLTASIIVSSLLVVFSPSDKKILVSDIIEPLSAAVATAFCCIIVYRQRLDGLMGRAFAILAAGLALFLAAEIIWSYFEIGLDIEDPFPSVADLLWLVGYGPILYFVLSMYHFLGASHSRIHQMLVCAGGASFMIYFVILTLQAAELTTLGDIASYLISTTYVALDVILLVPSALIILNPTKGELTSIPWIFLAVLIMSIGDITFAHTSSSGSTAAENLSWIWNLFFIASYILVAGGLFWHNKFFIISTVRSTKVKPDYPKRGS